MPSAALNGSGSAPERADALSFEERLGLLVDREITTRENRKLRLRDSARLSSGKKQPGLEDLGFRRPGLRNIDRSQIPRLLLRLDPPQRKLYRHRAAGVGKSYPGCAPFANKACREGSDALYFRVPRLFDELAHARADGSYTRRLNAIARCELLMLDDWGIAPFKDEQRRRYA